MIDANDLRRYAASPLECFRDSTIPGVHGDVRLGDVWADFQVEAFKVLADSVLAVAAGEKPPHRGLWIERTKGGSKDSDVGLALVWLLLFSKRPQLIEAGADDLGQILELKKAMADDLRLNPWKATRLSVQTSRIINESTGSECCFLTRDASGSHGSRPTVTVCNELAHVQSEQFMLTLMDNADKLARNLTIVATNAGELKSWQHRWRENYRTDPAWYFQKVDEPASWISQAKVADAERRNPPSRFWRLWRGCWVTPGGDALPATAIEAAIKHTRCLPEIFPGEHSVAAIGVDAGLTQHHAAVVVVVGSYWTQKLIVAKVVDFSPPVSLEAVRDTIIELGRHYRASFVAVDPWQMMRVCAELAGRGFQVMAQHQTGQVLTRSAAATLESIRDGVLQLYKGEPAAELLIEDLYSVRVVEKSYGHKLEFAENENGHGDRLSALANVLPFALEALGRPPAEYHDYDNEPVEVLRT
ncbi:MAG: hypothetical protein ABIP48_09775 [Planctomycetota bacterium]